MQTALFPFVAPKLSPEQIAALVHYEVIQTGQRWRVGAGTKFAGSIGVAIGTLGLKHASDYEVVLRFDDGRIASFAPLSLFPVKTDEAQQ